MKTNSFDKAAEQFANLMIEKIEQISADWQKPWISVVSKSRTFFPVNLNGRRYAGGNAFLLLIVCEKHDYQTPVFLTFNQAKEAGISVLKGAKSFPVYYFLFCVYHKETGHKITIDEYRELTKEEQAEYKVIPTYKYFNVFNLDQTNFSDVKPEAWEQLREKYRGKKSDPEAEPDSYNFPQIDEMLAGQNWHCKINVEQSDRAFYSPKLDYITVPKKAQFVDSVSFYETLLHEIAHSTGHPTRLNRDLCNPFGSPKYAREELVAEFSAALAGMSFGIAEHVRPENASYLKNWTEAIKEEPRFLLTVLGDTMKAVKMIAERLNISLEDEEAQQPEQLERTA